MDKTNQRRKRSLKAKVSTKPKPSANDLLKRIIKEAIQEEMEEMRDEIFELIAESTRIITEELKTVTPTINETSKPRTQPKRRLSNTEYLQKMKSATPNSTPHTVQEDQLDSAPKTTIEKIPLPKMSVDLVEAKLQAGEAKSTLDLLGGDLSKFGI